MSRSRIKKLVRRFDVTNSQKKSLPPGFDVGHYRLLNQDVAQACTQDVDAAAHYATYGIKELRRIMPDGVGIQDKQHRMLVSDRERGDWHDWITRKTDLPSLLQKHPRSAWLNTAFNLGSYLNSRPDVAIKLDDPLQGAFHFLEFGVEEGHYGCPHEVEPDHLQRAYPDIFGKSPTTDLTNIDQVVRQLRTAGHTSLTISLTESEFWELRGLPGKAMASAFDHEYYYANAIRAKLPPTESTRIACIEHFCHEGRYKNLAANPSHDFDPEFYLEHLFQIEDRHSFGQLANLAKDEREQEKLKTLVSETNIPPKRKKAFLNVLSEKSDWDAIVRQTLYLHWLRVGQRKGAAPNIKFWANAFFGIYLPEALADRLMTIATQSAQENGNVLDRLTRLLETPMNYLDHMPQLGLDEANALSVLGDKMAIDGNLDQAEWLYRTILTHYPDHEKTINHLADLMTRMGRAGAEYQLRMQSIALPSKKRGSSIWNILALAELALNQNRLQMAVKHIEQAASSISGDHAQYTKLRALVSRLFHHAWGQIGPYADDFGLPEAQKFLREILKLATPEQGPLPEKKGGVKNVALVANMDLYQCKLYRVDQKAEQLRHAGLNVSAFNQWSDLTTFRSRLDEFDAVIFYRVPAFPEIMEAIAACSAFSVPTFYEIDDLVFDTDLFPPAYENYSGQISREQHRDMACGVPLYEHAMRMCDYAIGSTRSLAEKLAKLSRSGRAFEHHNALGKLHLNAMSEHFSLPEKPDERPLVLFYGSGTLAHKEDFHTILEPALAEILKRYAGRVELQFVGSYGEFHHLDEKSEDIRILPPVWDFEQYCAMVSGADINLSVLAQTPVTDAKSEIKWMEAAMLGVPSVVSYTATHADVIDHGQTGFLCKTTKDFVKHISALIDDSELRKTTGQQAQDVVMTNYNLDVMGQNLVQIFDQIQPPERVKPLLMVVNVFYPPQAIGGATRVVHDNIMDLTSLYGDDYDICVVCSREGAEPYALSAYMQDGIPVWAIGTPDQHGTEMHARDPRMGEIFDNLLERLSPDLVHFHCIQRLTSSIADATRKRDIPYVITVHDGWWISPRQFLLDPGTDKLDLYDYKTLNTPEAPTRARSLWPALSGAQAVLAVSEAFATLHRDCHVPNVIVTENGVSRFPDVERHPHPEGRVRLAHIGGTERHKGLPRLRTALLTMDFDNLELLVIDHALPQGVVEHEVWGNTPVIRKGKLPQSEVDALYAQIDVLVAPSLWPESYGLVTREALASGAWVIASDRGAVGSDVTEGENGHIVDVSDSTNLIRVLQMVDSTPERYRAPPATRPTLRPAADQAKDLVGVYRTLASSS